MSQGHIGRAKDKAVNLELPFNKARELVARYRQDMPINLPIAEIDKEPPEPPNLLVDGFTIGGAAGPKQQKPLVRHVLVKDLNKVGSRMKLEHPKGGVFSNKAPMGLYCLFDGQSCAGEPGPICAEFCARNFHTTLLKRLAQLPETPANEAEVMGALMGTFADLDAEMIANQPDIQDGCGAAVCLIVGDRALVAVLGRCNAILGETSEGKTTAVELASGKGLVAKDWQRLRMAGGAIEGEGNSARLQHPMGATSSVSRSLGDRAWKVHLGTQGQIICTPEVQTVELKGCDEHPFLLLTTDSVSAALEPQELVDVSLDFPRQPRAACGEIATRAQEARAGAVQCTAVQLSFLPPRPSDSNRAPTGAAGPQGPPPSKKAKTSGAAPGGGTKSVRIRHILVRYNDGQQTPKGQKVTRTRPEAEAILRQVIGQLRAELRGCKRPPKDSTEVITVTTKKFSELCRKLSECETAQKGGHMCGELGWKTPAELATWGGSFKEVVEVLTQGQLSDIAVTDQGLHVVQRVA